MNLLDIIGPVMVGPSSSHTAGAVKIGRVSRKLLAEEVKEAKIYFHGSFLATGKGHGTDKALIAGLLGMQVDDPAIPDSFRIAGERGMDFSLEGIDLGDVHPNSVKMNLTGVSGRTLEVVAASIGGGRIQICELDGITANARTQGCQHCNNAALPEKQGWQRRHGHRVRSGSAKRSACMAGAVRGHIKSDILQSCGRVEFIIRK